MDMRLNILSLKCRKAIKFWLWTITKYGLGEELSASHSSYQMGPTTNPDK
jgi:hypothetical protein